MGNAWWTINNLNCGIVVNIDVNTKNTRCSNFTQIVKIQPAKGLSVSITKFTFGANLLITQHRKIYDHQAPINLKKKLNVRKFNISRQIKMLKNCNRLEYVNFRK
jgi:hypothetical protein